MYEIKATSYTNKGQLSTDKDERMLGQMLGHILIIPFPVWAGLKLFQPKQEMELWKCTNII